MKNAPVHYASPVFERPYVTELGCVVEHVTHRAMNGADVEQITLRVAPRGNHAMSYGLADQTPIAARGARSHCTAQSVTAATSQPEECST